MTFHEIHVERDGDDSDINRGELSFRWGLHELVVGSRGEDKLDDGATVTLDNAHNKHVIQGVGTGFLPPLYVNALERDADGWSSSPQRGRRHQDRLRTAGRLRSEVERRQLRFDHGGEPRRPLPVHRVRLARGVRRHPCLRLVSPDMGDNYPEFWAIVSFHRAG